MNIDDLKEEMFNEAKRIDEHIYPCDKCKSWEDSYVIDTDLGCIFFYFNKSNKSTSAVMRSLRNGKKIIFSK